MKLTPVEVVPMMNFLSTHSLDPMEIISFFIFRYFEPAALQHLKWCLVPLAVLEIDPQFVPFLGILKLSLLFVADVVFVVVVLVAVIFRCCFSKIFYWLDTTNKDTYTTQMLLGIIEALNSELFSWIDASTATMSEERRQKHAEKPIQWFKAVRSLRAFMRNNQKAVKNLESKMRHKLYVILVLYLL